MASEWEGRPATLSGRLRWVADWLDATDLILSKITVTKDGETTKPFADQHTHGAVQRDLRAEADALERVPPAGAREGCCHRCNDVLDVIDPPAMPLFGRSMSAMMLCPGCGNKRCPKATDHRMPCTGSNEPGQDGSCYPDPSVEAEIAAEVERIGGLST